MIGRSVLAWRTRAGLAWHSWQRAQPQPVRIVVAVVVGLPTLAALEEVLYPNLWEGVSVGLWTLAVLGVFIAVRTVVRRRRGLPAKPDPRPRTRSDRVAAGVVSAALPLVPIAAAVWHSPWWLLTLPSTVYIALMSGVSPTPDAAPKQVRVA